MSVVQFSTDVRTEWEEDPLGAPLDIGAFEVAVRSMVRRTYPHHFSIPYIHTIFILHECPEPMGRFQYP